MFYRISQEWYAHQCDEPQTLTPATHMSCIQEHDGTFYLFSDFGHYTLITTCPYCGRDLKAENYEHDKWLRGSKMPTFYTKADRKKYEQGFSNMTENDSH